MKCASCGGGDRMLRSAPRLWCRACHSNALRPRPDVQIASRHSDDQHALGRFPNGRRRCVAGRRVAGRRAACLVHPSLTSFKGPWFKGPC